MSDDPETENALDEPIGSPIGRWKRWPWILGGVAALLVLTVVAAAVVRLPYYTISPGSALDMNAQIEIEGADADDDPAGELLLLFVRQRARVNALRWIQASFDSDIDLYREQTFTGGRSPNDIRDAAVADMTVAQYSAKVVALQRLGYELEVERPGMLVLHVFRSMPAAGTLEVGDVIIRIDGQPVADAEGLTHAIQRHEPGETVEVTFVRDGETMTKDVPTEAAEGDEERTVIGVHVALPYEFPVDIEIDTNDIGGPSAGLAMTLAIVEALAPGEMTGGRSVAVTGTIALDGRVGPVGGVGQKALSARDAGATLFLVPSSEVEEARERVGDGLEVVGIDDLDDALVALERAGGDPIDEVQRDAA